MQADNVATLARCERLVRLIVRATRRSTDALLDFTTPALDYPTRYTVSRDRANKLRAAYWTLWNDTRGVR